jgi:hypothetical protein
MTGFVEARYEELPLVKHRMVRRMWNAVKQSTGTPPTLIHYRPPQKYHDGVWEPRSSWVIHHETGTFTFSGQKPADITEGIRQEGLIQQEA